MDALILASASARRRDFLVELGVDFEVDAADVDETPRPGEAPEETTLRLARAKAEVVAARRPGRWILAADTVVVIDGDAGAAGVAEILGKPRDRADARRMLGLLADREHRVVTAAVLLDPAGKTALAEAVVTRVRFRALADEEVEDYLASGEADDKAGAYGIQGAAGRFVAGVAGSHSNVVGLPLEVVETALRRAGFLAAEPRPA